MALQDRCSWQSPKKNVFPVFNGGQKQLISATKSHILAIKSWVRPGLGLISLVLNSVVPPRSFGGGSWTLGWVINDRYLPKKTKICEEKNGVGVTRMRKNRRFRTSQIASKVNFISKIKKFT